MGAFDYFGEREGAPREQRIEIIEQPFWGGIVAATLARLGDGSFAEAFPQRCAEYPLIVDADWDSLGQALHAEHHTIAWPLDAAQVPETLAALEVIEFFHHHVSRVGNTALHDYYRHRHILSFNKELGQREYRDLVNRLFRRNQLAYQLPEDGRIRRVIAGPLANILPAGAFNTGDDDLNRLLRQARDGFLSADPEVRRDSIEKLWDAWERIKTLLDADKQRGIQALLEAAIADAPFRGLVNAEGLALTRVGNDFMIRHMEADRIRMAESDYVDYLFHRMYSLIWLLLKRTGRL